MRAKYQHEPLERPLRVGLVCDGPDAELLAIGIDVCPELEFAYFATDGAVEADFSAQRVESARMIATESDVDVIVLACETRKAVEFSTLALGRGIHCWMRPPLGRNFSEAVALARLARQSEAVFFVDSSWERMRGAVRQILGTSEDFRTVISELSVRAVGPSPNHWRAGRTESGGGVLLQDAYEALEILVGLRGVPDSVYASVSTFRKPTGRSPHEIEEFAAAVLRFEGTGIAHLHALWSVECVGTIMRHHGATADLILNDETIALNDLEGKTLTALSRPGMDYTAGIAAFSDAILVREHRLALPARIERHLAVSAVVDAAYLSAQTSHAEAPQKLYAIEGWTEPRE